MNTEDGNARSIDPATNSAYDDLSFSSGFGRLLVERSGSPQSQIIDLNSPSQVLAEGARDPMLSADGESLAFIRDDQGRGQLVMRNSRDLKRAQDFVLTPSSLNVYEATFHSTGDYAFSAAESGRPPQIYLRDETHANEPLALGESRYPALSPDGKWLAYSRFENGVWNLWIRDQETGESERVGDVPCDQIQPEWEDDSKTLLYSTDCGRSLWFTAVARRRVVP